MTGELSGPAPTAPVGADHSDGIPARRPGTATPFPLGMPPRLPAAAPGQGHHSARDRATAPVSGTARRIS
ncbi:hypothetical protein ACN2WE_07290 [Streptomyces sp. cg28]|uniref:hypothetical protein n=1 Tax=Streptomyces sp. cg28 TaxID=3403457 RepID=UPI003B220763